MSDVATTFQIESPSISESQFGVFDDPTIAGGMRVQDIAHKGATRKSSEEVTEAVFAHIQAMRRLGHTVVNTHRIAQALGLTPRAVEAAIAALSDRGVRGFAK